MFPTGWEYHSQALGTEVPTGWEQHSQALAAESSWQRTGFRESFWLRMPCATGRAGCKGSKGKSCGLITESGCANMPVEERTGKSASAYLTHPPVFLMGMVLCSGSLEVDVQPDS